MPLAGFAARAAGGRIVASLRENVGDAGAVARFHERTAERYTQLLGGSKGVLMKVGQIFSMFDTDTLGQGFMPYHAALANLAEETCKRFGVAVVVDCHSMPSALSVPDIVLGDRYGASAAPALTAHAEAAFLREGFSVARNTPYAGGYTTMLYGRGSAGLFGLQIEINRGLYLDEDRIQRKPGFEALKKRLTESLVRLTAIDPSLLGGRNIPLAAE